MKFSFLSTALLCLVMATATAQPQEKNSQKVVQKNFVEYLSWLPSNYKLDKAREFPLIIFLHGSGERGHDLNLVKKWGPPSVVESRPGFQFIVLSPQCPENEWWDVSLLNAWLDQMMKLYRIDTSRVYLTGISMGGFATWQWASMHPERFAAIAPLCGGGDIQFAFRFKTLPVWAFHGSDDTVVPPKRSTEMVEAIQSIGGPAKLTLYEGVGHVCWRKPYEEDFLYNWFLQCKK